MDSAHAFSWSSLTEEDLERNQSYQTIKQRNQLQQEFVDYEDYLQSLQMCGEVFPLAKEEIPRFVQLLGKSNQFNLRTVRYSQGDILSFMEQEQYRLLGVRLSDRFSNYGMISCIILKKCDKACFIDTYLMSCRVLKRGVEDFVFPTICAIARQWGCDTLLGEYIPTSKNAMVEEFYPSLGFSSLSSEDIFKYSLSFSGYGIPTHDFSVKKHYIEQI